jgi:hypothetical protein
MKPSRTSTTGAVSVLAGAAYFALVFALGFLLGTVRALFVEGAPSAGRLRGVLIEIPVMLAASWFLCRYVVHRLGVAPTVTARSTMGGIAFGLLVLAELLIGALLFGRTASEHVALYRDASYSIGLAAQVAFALMPLLQIRHPA